MTRFGLGMAIAAVALFALSALPLSVAQVAAPAVQEVPQTQGNEIFDGKIVTVYIETGRPGTGHVLSDVKVVDIAGRKMLVGTGVDSGREGDWAAGLRVSIAWDTVRVFYTMTDAQFEEMLEKFPRD